MAKPWIGTLCGSVSGAMLAYILNYHVTFISKIEHRKALPKFLVIAMLGTIVQTSIVFVSVPRLHFIAAQLIATLFGLFFTFVLNRSWTFA